MQPKINTKEYEKIIKDVVIDDREKERKEYSMEQFAPFNPSIDHLLCGDYIFTGYNVSKNEMNNLLNDLEY